MTKSITLLVVVAGTVGAGAVPLQDAPTFPNIGYLGSGYNIIYGNPNPTGSGTSAPVDPGFKHFVYDMTKYGDGTLTPDQRYKVPNDVEVEMCQTCDLSFFSSEIAGTQSYSNSLEVSVEADFSGWGAKFSASTDYKRVEEGSKSYKNVVVKSSATCSQYCAAVDTFSHPNVTANFASGVKFLTTTYDEATYSKFITEFGTHVTTGVSMGAMFGQQSSISSGNWSRMVSTDLNVKASASYAAFGASGSVSVMTDKQKKDAETFSKYTTNQNIYMVGGHPPSDGQASTWVAAAISEPMPIALQLSPLSDLLDADHFPGEPDIATKQTNLVKALAAYCKAQKAKGVVDSCDPPAPDPPLPTGGSLCTGTTSSFGGGGRDFADPMPSKDKLVFATKTVQVLVRHGTGVDSLQLKMTDGKNTWLTGYHGGNGGSADTFDVPEGEYISQVNLWSGSQVDAVQFITNKGTTSEKYGGGGGSPHLLTFPGGDDSSPRLVGLFGRSGSRIDMLGFHYASLCPK